MNVVLTNMVRRPTRSTNMAALKAMIKFQIYACKMNQFCTVLESSQLPEELHL
jgi:hypothetical protein